jgi:hypothetical protein
MLNPRRDAKVVLSIAALLFMAGAAFARAQGTVLVMVAKIDGKLSTRNAKIGDVLSAKILKSWKLTDGADVPKGSKITGKVASVQSKKEGSGNSTLTFNLDQIEVKGGAAVPVHGIVVAIGPSLAPKDVLSPGGGLGRSPSPSGETGGAGANMGRGASSTNAPDPNASLGGPSARDEDNIPLGSTMPGVRLGSHPDPDWTTTLQGVHEDIDLDSDILIKVQLR